MVSDVYLKKQGERRSSKVGKKDDKKGNTWTLIYV